MTRKSKGFHVTASGTIQIETTNALLSSVYLCCSNAGTTWVLKIQDGAGSPKTIIDLALTSPLSNPLFDFKDGVRMDSGINIVTSGTAGVIDIWVTWQS